jgi:hypothetical protein
MSATAAVVAFSAVVMVSMIVVVMVSIIVVPVVFARTRIANKVLAPVFRALHLIDAIFTLTKFVQPDDLVAL